MSDLPVRVVVGKNGAYWRDYGDFYSMCVVSTDNDPVVPIAVYERVPLGTIILSAEQMETLREKHREAETWTADLMARLGLDAGNYWRGKADAYAYALKMLERA